MLSSSISGEADEEFHLYEDFPAMDQSDLRCQEKRADAAVEYMVFQGISKSRLVGIGFGKTRQINNCGDPGVICNEEQLAKNRRTEFKIRRKYGNHK